MYEDYVSLQWIAVFILCLCSKVSTISQVAVFFSHAWFMDRFLIVAYQFHWHWGVDNKKRLLFVNGDGAQQRFSTLQSEEGNNRRGR
jgi:hypothetical protein